MGQGVVSHSLSITTDPHPHDDRLYYHLPQPSGPDPLLAVHISFLSRCLQQCCVASNTHTDTHPSHSTYHPTIDTPLLSH